MSDPPYAAEMEKSLFLRMSLVALRAQTALYSGMAVWCLLERFLQ